MDDLLSSKSDSDEATVHVKQLIEIPATGGFSFTKWMSNSREVLAAIPASEVACDSVELDCNELLQERVLGVKWCAEEDLSSLKPTKSEFPNAKRQAVTLILLGLLPHSWLRQNWLFKNFGGVRSSGMKCWHPPVVASLEGRFEDFAVHRSSPMVRLASSRVPKGVPYLPEYNAHFFYDI